VVRASHNKPAANAFIKRVMGKAGQKILLRYGFLPRVKPKH
jgi:ABC-type molybdate transport system substrate-binding protein